MAQGAGCPPAFASATRDLFGCLARARRAGTEPVPGANMTAETLESCNCLNLWHVGVADCNATDDYIQLDTGLVQQCAAYWEQVKDQSSWEPEGQGPWRLWWLWMLLGLAAAGAVAALCASRPAPSKQPPREVEAQLGAEPRATFGRERGAGADAARGREASPAWLSTAAASEPSKRPRPRERGPSERGRRAPAVLHGSCAADPASRALLDPASSEDEPDAEEQRTFELRLRQSQEQVSRGELPDRDRAEALQLEFEQRLQRAHPGAAQQPRAVPRQQRLPAGPLELSSPTYVSATVPFSSPPRRGPT